MIHQTHISRWLLWGCLLFITIAEIITAAVQAQAGMVLHALLLVGLTLYGAAGELNDERKLALALTLAPLIRLLSLSLPLMRFPQAAWYPIVAVPLLLAAWLVVRLLQLPRRQLGLQVGHLPLQLLLIGGGLGLGAIEYLILQPKPMVSEYSWQTVLLPALSLVIFTGFTEEIIFRGLLQTVASPALGRWAVCYVALLFAALHIGYLSLADVVFVFAVGMLFGQIVRRGGSILGVTLVHGTTNVTLFLVMPYITSHPSSAVATSAPWAIWGGTAIALVAINFLVARRAVARQTVQPDMGTIIRTTRRQRGLTYTDVAQLTGMPVRLLAEIEHGLRLAQPEHLQTIARALGMGATGQVLAQA